MASLTVGADPEFFLLDQYGGAKSAHDLIDTLGSKAEPLSCEGGATQIDGTAIEFNITPARTEQEFLDNINTVLSSLRERVSPLFDFSFEPTVDYTEETFRDIPLSARLMGCEPDYNAWEGGRRNPAPRNSRERPFMRSAAGHLHVGLSNPGSYDIPSLVREIDTVLYPMSLLWDDAEDRRQLYGRPGAYRVKPYGLEYRTLSNKWLETRELTSFVYRTLTRVVERYDAGVRILDNIKYSPSQLTHENYARFIDNVLVRGHNYERPF